MSCTEWFWKLKFDVAGNALLEGTIMRTSEHYKSSDASVSGAQQQGRNYVPWYLEWKIVACARFRNDVRVSLLALHANVAGHKGIFRLMPSRCVMLAACARLVRNF